MTVFFYFWPPALFLSVSSAWGVSCSVAEIGVFNSESRCAILRQALIKCHKDSTLYAVPSGNLTGHRTDAVSWLTTAAYGRNLLIRATRELPVDLNFHKSSRSCATTQSTTQLWTKTEKHCYLPLMDFRWKVLLFPPCSLFQNRKMEHPNPHLFE